MKFEIGLSRREFGRCLGCWGMSRMLRLIRDWSFWGLAVGVIVGGSLGLRAVESRFSTYSWQEIKVLEGNET